MTCWLETSFPPSPEGEFSGKPKRMSAGAVHLIDAAAAHGVDSLETSDRLPQLPDRTTPRGRKIGPGENPPALACRASAVIGRAAPNRHVLLLRPNTSVPTPRPMPTSPRDRLMKGLEERSRRSSSFNTNDPIRADHATPLRRASGQRISAGSRRCLAENLLETVNPHLVNLKLQQKESEANQRCPRPIPIAFPPRTTRSC